MTLLIPGLLFLAAIVVLAVAAFRTSRAAYESAPYQIVRSDGKFEVRDYPALTVIETPMARAGTSVDGSFMRLFRFITGQNEAKEKIPMTTPVFMSGNGSQETMSFVLPATLRAEQTPKPLDGSVKVRVLPAGRYAVLRFSGARSSKIEFESFDQLKVWMGAQGLSVSSSAVFAYFDPPWTPGFMRRNEVMLRIENSGPSIKGTD
jgi:DNA gyrase inhibitor GyrI